MIKSVRLFVLMLLAFLFGNTICAQKGDKLKLRYDKPAKLWNEALPIGNGRLGAMVFGSPSQEKIQLNENTLWQGGPCRNDNPDALGALPIVRQLIFSGKYDEAQDVVNKSIISKKLQGASYQTIGNILLNFPNQNGYTDYTRELDIEKAIETTSYTVSGVTYKREIFASKPDQVIVVRLTASKPGHISFSTEINGPLQLSVKNIGRDMLEQKGISSDYENIKGQVKFSTLVKIVNSGGEIKGDSSKIKVTNANTVTIYVSIATNFKNHDDLSANDSLRCINYLIPALQKSYAKIKNDHIAEFQKYFKRVRLDLGTSKASELRTDVRIKNFSHTYDPELVTLFFQFGRYLLISSSQPGGQPANLQGLWNDQVIAPWDSKYTVNINTEMNYWPAEITNLSEMHDPLIQLVKDLSIAGKQTAKTMYGAKGWVTHHNTDIWRMCGPVDGSFWGMWPMGGAWLSQHLWEKYAFSGDINYLKTVYPILKSACEFYLGFMVEEPKHQWMVVCPSVSPENAPSVHPNSSISEGTTMDNEILFGLFNKTIKAAQILNTDTNFIDSLRTMIHKMSPLQVGKYGQLQEWIEDWDNPKDTHRHVSHLFGVFPGDEISAYKTPKLLSAARTSLVFRGDVSTGWSMGWKVNLWARMLDGNHAFKLITDQLTLVDPARTSMDGSGGTYPNLFDACPPFQIDGNFGCTSGIAEMIMQSHDGAINIIPAIPDSWKSGSIKGLRARGGFETAIYWENHQVKKLIIKSVLGGNCRIRVPNSMILKSNGLISTAVGENVNPFYENPEIHEPVISTQAGLTDFDLKKTYLYDIQTIAGKTYIFERE